MFEEMTEQQAREQILEMTRNYCNKYHNQKKPYQEGDRIPYASRVYDAEEMVNLVGRFPDNGFANDPVWGRTGVC